MLDKEASQQALATLFRGQMVVDLRTLFSALKTSSRMSVFRRLKSVGYLSSYTHRGAYYTLPDIPLFDGHGLWFHQGVGFSRAGTLKATLVAMVDAAEAGHTHRELEMLLRIRVRNTLVQLVRECRIGRHRIKTLYLYVSAISEQSAAQLARRQEGSAGVAAAPMAKLAETTLIEILLEVVRTAPVTVRPAVVADRLRARAVAVTTAQVEQVFAHYGLGPGKKTAEPGSRPSKSSER